VLAGYPENEINPFRDCERHIALLNQLAVVYTVTTTFKLLTDFSHIVISMVITVPTKDRPCFLN